ncbi:UvrD-helicase domain-containing protein [Nocardia thailandica]|uniref:DNA 3'-5' helicase n=1 Tax=Nocardia thailandica TaxID=257275 RepID=A0ABW6PWL4_9NOCA
MATLGIDKDFLLDFGKLDRPLQTKVAEVFEKFSAATHAGIHLEKINNSRHPRYRSIKIDNFWRGIVLAPEFGDAYTLLKVLPHDDAYVWARRRDISVNRATGGIEISDQTALEAAMPAVAAAAEHSTARLFENISDKDLARLGVEERTRVFARALVSVEALEAAHDFLPTVQWQVLYGLAAGLSPDDVWHDLCSELIADNLDTDDLDAAVQRSYDRVFFVNGPDELMAVFDNPFALWRIYLHPAQQSLVDATYSGPARVSGGPGTGKTVVALHRARRLAEKAAGKVLVTTFTGALADSLHDGILMLVDSPSAAARIKVANLDSFANQIYRETHGTPILVSDEGALWAEARAPYTDTISGTFLAEEWRHVVLAQEITTEAQYLAARRPGRGRALPAARKPQVWAIIKDFEQLLRDRGLCTYETIRRAATTVLNSRPDKPFRHIVVDEAQDLCADHWRLIRAAVPVSSDDIFIAGDTHQRIYKNQVTLRAVGIDITGRSRRLSLNYRTTAEILAWSLGIIQDEPIDDMEAGLDSIAGCHSEVHGEPPELDGLPSIKAELDKLVETIRAWLDVGVAPDEIGVATRMNFFAEEINKRLRSAGVPTNVLSKGSAAAGAVSVGTMHNMKGLEFRCLVVAGVSDKNLPAPKSITPIDEDAHTHDLDLRRERCLLFVACTRAREQLHITWHGEPSTILPSPH